MHTGSGLKLVVKVICVDPGHRVLLFHEKSLGTNTSDTGSSPGSIWRPNMWESGSPLVIPVTAGMDLPDDGHDRTRPLWTDSRLVSFYLSLESLET
jgi:hypothetical protein